MFLTPQLERIIIKNKAFYKQITCANGSFYSFPIQKNQTVIVIGIEWTPFIAPEQDIAALLLQDWLADNEYQLRVEDGGSKNFLHYRNHLNFTKIDNTAVLASGTVADFFKSFVATPGDKILTPLFWVFTNEEVRIAVTRTRGTNSAYQFGILTPNSLEPTPPNGLKGVPVLLRQDNGSNINYVPPLFPQNSPVPPTIGVPGATQGFFAATDAATALIDPTLVDVRYRNIMLPFFTLHYVVIKENLIGLIQ